MQQTNFHDNDNKNKNVSLIISQRMNILCLTEDCLNMIKDVDVFIALKFLTLKS